jgi:type III pantothenate kinase
MTTNLCIDWGNTRVKVGIFQENRLSQDFNFSEAEGMTAIINIVRQIRPEHTILSSVANHPEEFQVVLNEETKLLTLNEDTRLPIINAYQSPATLGMDRIALAVGAYGMAPDRNNLVVSTGTAITYNFVQKGGTFRGGNIAPGMQLRFKALHEFTDKLPLVNEQGDTNTLLGYDTVSSIRSGVVWGIAAELEGMLNYYQAQYSDLNAVLTGGDLALFADKFKSRIFADSHFLLKGLNTILNYNVR